MAMTAQALKPPVHAPAPPVRRVKEATPTRAEAPQRLLTSLSAVPAVQRACAACSSSDDTVQRQADEDENEVMARRENAVIRRLEEDEEAVMPRREGPGVRRMEEEEEEEIMARRESAAIRRMEEDEDAVMPRRGSANVQRMEEEEEEIMARREGTTGSRNGEAPRTTVQPRLPVGAVNDPYEREADDIAGQVMAMREPGQASGAAAGVQRKCAGCGGEDEMPVQPLRQAHIQRNPLSLVADAARDEQDKVRMKEAGAGGETLGASANRLTSGGSALSPGTRDFFEARMGRDLSDVRIHKGSESDGLNSEISARAFTYKNHIWLGRNESESPSFTMAHEMAHVLQQTQPGALNDEAMARRKKRRAPPRVQRSIADEDLRYAPDGRLGGYHDAATLAATGSGGIIWSELRVPNANRGGLTKVSSTAGLGGGFGFADLVVPTSTGTNLWGLGFLGTPSEGPPKPWHHVSDASLGNLTPRGLGYPKGRPAAANGRVVSGQKMSDAYFNISAPRFHTTDFVSDTTSGGPRDAKTAPTAYAIGEMKFLGIKDRETMASNQTDFYVEGYELAKNNYNTLVQQANTAANTNSNSLKGKSKYANLSTSSFTATKMASGVGPSEWTQIPQENLTIYPAKGSGSGDDEKADKQDDRGVPGDLYFRQNSNGYLWEYGFLPKSMALSDLDAQDKTVAKDLKDGEDLADAMTATPGGGTVSTRRLSAPARPYGIPPRPVRRAKAVVRRRGRKRVPRKDPFVRDYANWTKKQKAFTGKFNAYAKPKVGKPNPAISQVRHDTALINAIEDFGNKAPKGKTFPTLKTNAKTTLKKTRKRIKRSDLVAGKSGRMLGVLRKTFGGAYIRVVNIYRSLKRKLNAFWKDRKKKFSKSGSMAATMMRVGGKIIFQIIKKLLPKVAALLKSCVEQGFQNIMNKAIEDVKKATFVGDIEQAVVDLETKALELEKKIQNRATAMANKLTTDYESLLTTLKTAGTLLRIAKDAIMAARLAFCIAGGVESGGLACALSGIDWLLGKVGWSPTENAIAWLMGTCLFKGIVTDKILALKQIKALPNQIAQMIVDKVRPTLKGYTITPPAPLTPITLDSLLCPKITGTVKMPTSKDFPCGGKSGGKGSGTGSGKSSGSAAKDQENGNDGGKSQSSGGDGDGGGSQKDDDLIVVTDPEAVNDAMTDPSKFKGDIVIIGGFDLDNPPAENARVDVRVRLVYPDAIVTMTQEIVFLEVKTFEDRRRVRCYLPQSISPTSKAKKGPYKISKTRRFTLNRGSNSKFDAPVKGQK